MAYDIAAAQRLATPVTSMYRGRALRMAEQQAEQSMRIGSQEEEINALKIEALKNPKPNPEEQRAADKARRERAAEMIALGKDTATRTLSLYRQAKESGSSEEEARAVAQQLFNTDLQFASEIYGKELAGRIDPDGVWSPEEAEASITQIEDLIGKNSDLEDAVVFRDPTGKPVGAARKGTPQYEALISQGALPGAEIGRPKDEATPEGEGTFDNAAKLRGEYNTQSKEFVGATQGYQNVLSASKNPSAAGDLALIFSYMKTLDPGSSVREGEFANAENSGGVPARIRAQYNKVLNGERLSDEQRTDFVSQAGELYKGYVSNYNRLRTRYESLSERAGISPEDVIGESLAIDAPDAPGRSVADLSDDELKQQLGL